MHLSRCICHQIKHLSSCGHSKSIWTAREWRMVKEEERREEGREGREGREKRGRGEGRGEREVRERMKK